MTAENAPLPSEPIRVWMKRVRQNRDLKTALAMLRDNQWPVVTMTRWSQMSGVSEWLEKNVGTDNYVWTTENFWFTNPSDAIMFKLAWTEKGN